MSRQGLDGQMGGGAWTYGRRGYLKQSMATRRQRKRERKRWLDQDQESVKQDMWRVARRCTSWASFRRTSRIFLDGVGLARALLAASVNFTPGVRRARAKRKKAGKRGPRLSLRPPH